MQRSARVGRRRGARVGGMGQDLAPPGRRPWTQVSCLSRHDGSCRPFSPSHSHTWRADRTRRTGRTRPIAPRTASSGCSRISRAPRPTPARLAVGSAAPAGGLVPQPAEHPGAQHLQLSLGHGPLRPSRACHRTCRDDRRWPRRRSGIGDPAGPGAGTTRPRTGPAGRPPAPARYRPARARSARSARRSRPGPRARPAHAQVGVDDADRAARPAQRAGPAHQVVLAQGPLTVTFDLDQGGLAAVDGGRAAQMRRRYLGITHAAHPAPPRWRWTGVAGLAIRVAPPG